MPKKKMPKRGSSRGGACMSPDNWKASTWHVSERDTACKRRSACSCSVPEHCQRLIHQLFGEQLPDDVWMTATLAALWPVHGGGDSSRAHLCRCSRCRSQMKVVLRLSPSAGMGRG